MKKFFTLSLFMIAVSNLFANLLPLTDRYFQIEDIGNDYGRGIFMIVLADASLENILRDESTGDFIAFKKSQGYDVEIVIFGDIGGTSENLKSYLQYFSSNNPLLEYVLLVGDVNGSYSIPPHTIPSYNESELDVTDYPYTFFTNDPLNAEFIIGRWPIRTQDDLKKIKKRSIQYVKMDYIQNYSFLNNALLVAGNFSDADSLSWPVTPVWTSKWLMDELSVYGFNQVDTAFFHLQNQQAENPLIRSSWNNGVGIVNYRGWGDANGWHKPYFHRENIDPGLNNGWYLPIVMSFVCNTGDFGNDYGGVGLDKSFGEVLITGGSINNPKGAAAMIGPSDLDTDTRFNNVLCAVLWDELLEGRIPEIGPALHAGKKALLKEFGDLEVNGTNIVNFYHHVYSVIGDPSLPVWLGIPKELKTDLNSLDLTASHLSTIVMDKFSNEPIMDVVGVLLHEGEIIAKGLSNQLGELDMDFEGIPENSQIDFYLNKSQYHQKKINLYFSSDDGSVLVNHHYEIPSNDHEYVYTMTVGDLTVGGNSGLWNELVGISCPDLDVPGDHCDSNTDKEGINLNLTDDSLTRIPIGFDFQYYGHTFDSLTICSNGWASFMPCLQNDPSKSCNEISYFYNNSITHPLGAYGLLAPFFDDLDDNLGAEDFNVFYATGTDSLIVQWDRLANGQTDENCPDCVKETFQLLLDGTIISPSGDGQIVFKYLEIHDIDDHGSTIGIESPDKNSGIEFLFNYDYSDTSFDLQDMMQITFTSDMSYVPGCMDLNAINFNPNASVDDGTCEFEECLGLIGDLSGDGSWNVIDVIALVNCVLQANCDETGNGCVKDINNDDDWNVMDVVELVNCILNSNC